MHTLQDIDHLAHLLHNYLKLMPSLTYTTVLNYISRIKTLVDSSKEMIPMVIQQHMYTADIRLHN